MLIFQESVRRFDRNLEVLQVWSFLRIFKRTRPSLYGTSPRRHRAAIQYHECPSLVYGNTGEEVSSL